jgi:hypothetical protein
LAQRHGDPEEFFSWFAEADGIIPGRPVSRVVTTYNKGGERRLIEFHSTDPIEIIEEPGLPPISGGSNADLQGVPTGRATEGPPKPPGSEAPRQSRALLDVREVRGTPKGRAPRASLLAALHF